MPGIHDVITATYRVTTPMFCGGAHPIHHPELRLPSFKGVLRFWWRAVVWERLGGDINLVRTKEDQLFGSASSGQSKVLLRFAATPSLTQLTLTPPAQLPHGKSRTVGEGARYLGYGVMNAYATNPKNGKKRVEDGELLRSCLLAPFEFSVEMRCRNLQVDERETLLLAVRAMGLLGGMGSRSRRGYGSLVLRTITNGETTPIWTAPSCIESLRNQILSLTGNHSLPSLPEYTALSIHTRHILLEAKGCDALELLDRVGREMVRYRSWGRQGKILKDRDSEKNFKNDHDLMKLRQQQQRKSYPLRICFGLPHNYGKYPDQQVTPADPGLDRRGSPLLIHIHELSDQPVAIVSFMPARFLPDGRSDISVGGNCLPLQSASVYDPIREFLDRLLQKGTTVRKEHFDTTLEVNHAPTP